MNVEYMEKCYDVQKPRIPGEALQYRNQTNKYLITLQLLLENYSHFLVTEHITVIEPYTIKVTVLGGSFVLSK